MVVIELIMDCDSNPNKLEHAFIADILNRIKVEEDDIEIKYEVLGDADANETDKYSDVYVSNVVQKFKGYSHYNNTTLLSEVTDKKCHQKDHLELEDNCNIVNEINLSVPTNHDSVDTDRKVSHQEYEKKNKEEKTCRFCFKMCCNCKTMDGETKRIKLEHSYATLKSIKVEEDDIAIKYEVLGEVDAYQCDEYFDLDAPSVGQQFKSYLRSNNTTLLSEVSDEECELNNQSNHLEDNCNLVNKIKLPVAANAELVDMDSTEILECHQNYERLKPEERICRFCFTTCCNFKTIDGDIKEVSNVVLPGIDLAAIQEPVMCTLCEEILFTSFDFKVRCLYTHDDLIPFVNKKDGVKLNLQDIYRNKHKNNIMMPEDQDVCGFCMCPVENCSVKFIDVGERDIMLWNKLGQCLPELDLSIIEKPVICAPCHSSLEKHFRFVSGILIIEEKIEKYKETLDINSKGDVIKLEKIFYDNGASVEGVEHECTGSVDMDDLKFNNEQKFTPTNMLADETESNRIGAIKTKEKFCGYDGTKFKEENIVKVEDQIVLLEEEIEIKTDELDFNSFEDGIHMTPLKTRLNGKQECSVMPNFMDNLLKRHVVQSCINKDVTKITSCSFATNYKDFLNIHLPRYNNLFEIIIYKCHLCTYQTKNKSCLKSHLMKHKNHEVTLVRCDSTVKKHVLNHKNPSEATIHECDLCAFQTIHRSCLQTHLMKHKIILEVKIHKCDLCAYQTIRRGNLKAHLPKHKNISEVTVHKCDMCLYQTNYKSLLEIHSVIHKHPLEVTMHKCDSCGYQTISKGNLEKHLLTHKDISGVTKYKCASCLYLTKCKSELKEHLLKHRDSSEVTIHKCDSCEYQTKYKSSLKIHSLQHKDISEVTMYKCDSCGYQTKYKSSLKKHSLQHKDISEVTMYKCALCLYQTKYKPHLITHSLKHKNPSEVMHRCGSCAYQTIYKCSLKLHLLKHKNIPEVTVYKCDLCLFQTKYYARLETHLLTCKNSSEVTMHKCDSSAYQTTHKRALKTFAEAYGNFINGSIRM